MFVIYAHVLDRNSYRYIFYAFHMPLFFFLSGIVYHHKKNEAFITFLKKNVRRIILPYFIFALITYTWWIFAQNSGHFNIPSFISHLRGILYASGAGSGLFFNTILWFLPCLFAAKVIIEALTRISDKTSSLILSFGILGVIGYFFSVIFPETKLPYQIETALTAVVFIGLGYFFYRYKENLLIFLEKYKWQILSASLIILLLTSMLNYSISGLQNDMRLNRLNNVFLFYASSISGITASIILSMIIRKNSILEYFGKISIFLFVFHPLVIFYLNKLVIMLNLTSFIQLGKNTFIAPIYTLISLLIISGIYYLYKYSQSVLPKGT